MPEGFGLQGVKQLLLKRRIDISSLFMDPRIAAIAERICRSETFRSSPRLQELLRYLVKQQAACPLKESLIGVEFFRREPGFDPRKDPIVRVEAHRLRRRLRECHQREGAREPWRIELPAGAYAPVLSFGGKSGSPRSAHG